MIAFAIFCCWIVSFFFNGIESGLLSIDPVRLRQNVKRRVPAALRLNRLLKHPERLLVTVLLFTNAADILGLLLLTRQLVRSWGYAGFVFSLAIALPVYLFLLSVLPKSLFRRFPFRASGAARQHISNSHRSCFPRARARRAAGPVAVARSRGETSSAFCRARRAQADHDTKRARGLSHRYRARDDP